MEHIVQFAVGIDDDAIVKEVTKYARDQIIKDLNQQVKENVFDIYKSGWGAETNKGLQNWAKDRIDIFLNENKEEILNRVTSRLVDRVMGSKAMKEIVADIKKEATNDQS